MSLWYWLFGAPVVKPVVVVVPPSAPPPPTEATGGPVDTLARTIWAEARGEPPGGMEAVASVILRRAAHPRWWGRDVISVCRTPMQFSCWNSNDPNLPKLLAVTTDDPQFVRALSIAARACAGRLPDNTNGADSYVDLRVVRPVWADPAKQVAKIGNHTFYRLAT